jgi:hypothetical protein
VSKAAAIYFQGLTGILEPRTYSLAKFPENYALYRFLRAKGDHADVYLYGESI